LSRLDPELHTKNLLKLESDSTKMLIGNLKKLSASEADKNLQQDGQVDQLQRELQTVTGERDTLKLILEESGIELGTNLEPAVSLSMGKQK